MDGMGKSGGSWCGRKSSVFNFTKHLENIEKEN